MHAQFHTRMNGEFRETSHESYHSPTPPSLGVRLAILMGWKPDHVQCILEKQTIYQLSSFAGGMCGGVLSADITMICFTGPAFADSFAAGSMAF